MKPSKCSIRASTVIAITAPAAVAFAVAHYDVAGAVVPVRAPDPSHAVAVSLLMRLETTVECEECLHTTASPDALGNIKLHANSGVMTVGAVRWRGVLMRCACLSCAGLSRCCAAPRPLLRLPTPLHC